MKTRYAVHGGYVYSVSDGDRHRIHAHRVAELYRLPSGSWVVWPERPYGLRWDDFIHLWPREDGNYEWEEHGA